MEAKERKKLHDCLHCSNRDCTKELEEHYKASHRQLDKLFETSSSADVMTAQIREKRRTVDTALKPVERIDFVQSAIVSVEKPF